MVNSLKKVKGKHTMGLSSSNVILA